MKVLPIAPQEGAPYVAPTLENVYSHAYPLSRYVYIYVNRPPGQPLQPKVKGMARSDSYRLVTRLCEEAVLALKEGRVYTLDSGAPSPQGATTPAKASTTAQTFDRSEAPSWLCGVPTAMKINWAPAQPRARSLVNVSRSSRPL